jgi:AcrR family transcriptional regulator
MRRLRAPERRKVILGAAENLFARGGFAAMTTAAVAKASGVAEPVIYQHFSSKKELLRVLLKRVVERVAGTLRVILADRSDPVKALSAYCRQYPRIAAENKREFRVINRALAELDDAWTRALLREHYGEYHRILAPLVREGQLRGQLRSDISPGVAAWHLINSALGYLLTKNLSDRSQQESQYESGLATAVLDGLMEAR